MSRSKEFIKNTLILFVGKFATQFTSFLLIPLFTHYLISDDYGWVDLLQTYITLFVPILTLRMDSALFRFLVDKRNDEKGKANIISNVIFITAVGLSITILISICLYIFIDIRYFVLTIINLIVMMISNVFLQILRGLGKNKEYSIASCIAGILTLIVNILLIVVCKYGAGSILVSATMANLAVIIYISIIAKIFKYLSIKQIDKKILKQLLNYSVPMIPNSLSWWIVNVSDRTIITLFLGAAFNGIYSISCKFSNLLNSVYSIFNMSWQETASLHINDSDRDEFYSDMIMKLFSLFACLSLLINAMLPIFFNLLIGNEYISSYNYIPILLYANTWNIMISLIGGIYIALKRTKEIANTTIMSAIINIIVNFVLIKFIGLYAAAISTLIAYVSMSFYRYFDLKKYVKLSLKTNKILLFTLIFIISSLLYITKDRYLNILNIAIAMGYSFYENKDTLKDIRSMLTMRHIKQKD